MDHLSGEEGPIVPPQQRRRMAKRDKKWKCTPYTCGKCHSFLIPVDQTGVVNLSPGKKSCFSCQTRLSRRWRFKTRPSKLRSHVVRGPCCLNLQILPWRWRQHGPPKRYYPTTAIHGVTAQKTMGWITVHQSLSDAVLHLEGTASITSNRKQRGLENRPLSAEWKIYTKMISGVYKGHQTSLTKWIQAECDGHDIELGWEEQKCIQNFGGKKWHTNIIFTEAGCEDRGRMKLHLDHFQW